MGSRGSTIYKRVGSRARIAGLLSLYAEAAGRAIVCKTTTNGLSAFGRIRPRRSIRAKLPQSYGRSVSSSSRPRRQAVASPEMNFRWPLGTRPRFGDHARPRSAAAVAAPSIKQSFPAAADGRGEVYFVDAPGLRSGLFAGRRPRTLGARAFRRMKPTERIAAGWAAILGRRRPSVSLDAGISAGLRTEGGGREALRIATASRGNGGPPRFARFRPA